MAIHEQTYIVGTMILYLVSPWKSLMSIDRFNNQQYVNIILQPIKYKYQIRKSVKNIWSICGCATELSLLAT